MMCKGVKDVLGCLPTFDKCDVGRSSVTWRSSHFHQSQSPDHAVQEIRPVRSSQQGEETHPGPGGCMTLWSALSSSHSAGTSAEVLR